MLLFCSKISQTTLPNIGVNKKANKTIKQEHPIGSRIKQNHTKNQNTLYQNIATKPTSTDFNPSYIFEYKKNIVLKKINMPSFF